MKKIDFAGNCGLDRRGYLPRLRTESRTAQLSSAARRQACSAFSPPASALIFRETSPISTCQVTATGGSVENIRRVNGGEAEMGLSFSSDVHEAYYGLEQFKGKPLTNYRAVGLVFFGVAHTITFADSGIRTVDDLAGKRVAVGTPGSGTFASAERVFRALGVWDKINRIPLSAPKPAKR